MTGFFCKEAKPTGDNRLKIFHYQRKQILNIFYKLRGVWKLKLELNLSFPQRRVGENVSQYGPFNNISGDKVKTIHAALYLCTLY